MRLRIQHLLGLEGVSREDINLILDTADGFHGVLQRDIKVVPPLRGKTVVNLFTKTARARAYRLNWPRSACRQAPSIFPRQPVPSIRAKV